MILLSLAYCIHVPTKKKLATIREYTTTASERTYIHTYIYVHVPSLFFPAYKGVGWPICIHVGTYMYSSRLAGSFLFLFHIPSPDGMIMNEAFPSVGDQVRGSEGPLEQIINWFPAYVLVLYNVPCKWMLLERWLLATTH